MNIQKVPISQILPHPDNPRITLTSKDPEYQQIKKSLKAYGYIQPLILNKRSGYLVSGHQRFSILIAEGIQEIEVVVVDLDPQQEKNLMVALNKITGRWDNEKLSAMLDEFTKIPDFDCELLGFTMPEISQLLDAFHKDKDGDDFDFGAAIESITEPITKKGDLIELGKHKLLCGDSSSLDDIKLLMASEKISLVHSDPPYNVNYYGGNRPTPNARPKKSRNWERIYSDNLSQKEYEDWLKKIFTNMQSFLKKGAPFYIWNGHKQFGPMHEMLEKLGCHVACVITWAKPNFAISYADYNQQTEFCLYGWKKDNGAHIWYGPTNESTLWEIKRDATKNCVHPTQKPIALAQRAVKNSSERGDVVLDLFLGSGSTLIAAESLSRRCFGIEIDPKYCDAIVKRYIAFVGRENISQELAQKYTKETSNVGK